MIVVRWLQRHVPRGLRGGIVVGLAVALLGISVGTAAGVDTPFQKVIVVNAPANPIPVVQQGSISVSNLPSNQSVTVSNFPVTQPVSGTVDVTPIKVTKAFHEFAQWDASDFYEFDFGGTINVSALTLSDTGGGDSMGLTLLTATSATEVPIHDGGGFSRDFTVPVPAHGVRIFCMNLVSDCDADLSVFGI